MSLGVNRKYVAMTTAGGIAYSTVYGENPSKEVTHPFDLGQSMDGILDGVCRDDVRVVSSCIILAGSERELHVGLQLDDVMVTALSPDDEHLHGVLPIARSHKLHIL